MLSEFFEYLRSKASKPVKNLGYVYSSIALVKRAKRQKEDWNEHIRSCHNLWMSILHNESYKSITVLGSGPLTELPVDFILDRCDELRLVDIVHPRAIRSTWSKNPKIKFVEADLTGAVNWLSELKELPTCEFAFSAPAALEKADLVVSANLFSQLSLEPSWYLNKKFGLSYDSELMKALIEKLLEEHIYHLKTYGAQKVVAYTDVERSYLNPDGEVLEVHKSRVPDESLLGKKLDGWEWNLCPLGEESKDYEIKMRVRAFELPLP